MYRFSLVSALGVVSCTAAGSTDPADPTHPPGPAEPTHEDASPGTGGLPSGFAVSDLSWEHNPHFLGPFTVTWHQTRDGVVHVEYRVDGHWLRTPDIDGRAGASATTVVGVPLGTTAPWRIVARDGSSYDGDSDLVALPVPNHLPRPFVPVSRAALWSASGAYIVLPINFRDHFTSYRTAFYVVVDRMGRPVWATKGTHVHSSEVSTSGQGLLWADTERDEAYRAYLDEPIRTVRVPGHYHALVGLPDGTIVWDDGDDLYELSPDAASPRPVWSGEGIEYINGIAYDPRTDQLGLSSWWAQSIAVVNRGSYSLAFTAPGIPGTRAFGFDPAESRLDDQHGIEFLSNGNVLASTVTRGTVWLREYQIDETAELLREVWSFNSGFDDVSWSWAHRLDSGNTLHTLGPQGRVYEVTPTGEVAWRAIYTDPIGRAQVVRDLYELVAP